MLTLSSFNLVDDHRDKDLIVSCLGSYPTPLWLRFSAILTHQQVTYDYHFLAGFRKPITIIAAVFGIFAVATALAKVDVRIGRNKV